MYGGQESQHQHHAQVCGGQDREFIFFRKEDSSCFSTYSYYSVTYGGFPHVGKNKTGMDAAVAFRPHFLRTVCFLP